ncbi:hypothetical protein [Nocardia tengchongensis]|uniref:hypothetical protein n=1 Tax=Nocardia tengchongensis TaxID=2055889 RepID=UPI00365F9886
MSEDFPEPPPARARRPTTARPTTARPAPDRDDTEPRKRAPENLPREHDDDRSPADPNDWNDDWDRARWAP